MKLSAAVMTVLLAGIPQAGDTELRFRVDFRTNRDKAADLRKVQQVLETRFRLSRGTLPEPRITLAGDDQVILQIPGGGREKLGDYKKLATVIGKIELKEVGTPAIHDEHTTTKVVPAGYEAYTPQDGGDLLLVKAEAVVTGEDIKKADAQPSFEMKGAAGTWHVAFEMHEPAAKRFDEVAGKLYAQSPKGRIAIIVDGRVDAAPQLQSNRFEGKCQITGSYSEADARRIAIVLRSGALPVGRILVADEAEEKR
jgi:SecD/SecF fusion protein